MKKDQLHLKLQALLKERKLLFDKEREILEEKTANQNKLLVNALQIKKYFEDNNSKENLIFDCGSAGYELGKPFVQLPDNMTELETIEALLAEKSKKFVRTKQEINKLAIQAAFKEQSELAEFLKDLGFKYEPVLEFKINNTKA